MNRSFRARSSNEDPLTYLPRKPVQEFAKGTVVYDLQRPNDHLYVVILGRVKVTSTSDDGVQTVARIVCAEGLFGESCLVGGQPGSEAAVALDNANVMAWSRADIEQQIEREPHLGIALSQYLVRECIELQDRIESMAVHKTPERVMLALLQLAEDLGSPTVDGSVRIASLTHHTIAEYVGTSREIVTFQMNRLRRNGLLRYSRKFIDINVQSLQDGLRNGGITVPQLANKKSYQSTG
ncbi:MAG TPA: Crp/Fnr family transcriptional regulator [Candidatus Sulfopaludibacter sp.]|jgi:CRP/FNR family transcriptional regulator|nr:Crp/Fnr family transcriptional regulator [Candidatus Sulfopaludibacter sp.]